MAVALIGTVAASFIGCVAWREWWLVSLTALIPVLVGVQIRRSLAWLVALAYFGTASRELMGVYRTFTGHSIANGALAWLIATLILAMPLTLAWTANRAAMAWRMPLALVSTALPPLGLIGWASPLTAAGVLFPGTAWFGLSVTALAPGLMLAHPRPAVFVMVLTSLVAWISYQQPKENTNWQSVNTFYVPKATDDLDVADSLQTAILSSGAKVTVFPELIIKRWTEATDLHWKPVMRTIGSTHRLAIVGAGLPVSASADYLNTALIIGGPTHRAFVQRISVPVGMWRPLTGGPTVPLHLLGPGTMDVAGERVAFLICYEQLLVWPILQSAIEHPTLIVGMANQYWIRDTSIPRAQRASTRAWARLFALPLLISENR
jgi:hypothetical protein